ncbi:ubiquitin-protein ligase E3 C [Cryptococcus deuterogattii 99/473]|uniref:HECT-type E3 ubiquitin transferase n=2 Tax=Cryptococcus deuterogattii TaxID=1859096 RepID=A0A0D0TAD4_9TREE|nr:ubiquitin-protein ligase E3 C [Cryptococcus deuterogattii R265]KIR36035.1 ubiquitin-protein ligase E3 C [Cryptococcus deuterogattii MMRL2647]KIR43007.1 ubiquitin-protein ligase E3 C [Cryptococcus deuterogattii Ram5]KIR75468.1 ubiquitin-protein ligase E3 C [Cryptococcus deuterogattii CA1014]KIS01904.1 ubiquitin-protein ligase E3 C [Cryptococcus deuterogattii 2001/935-1]KIY56343.1 ubiquitin-protein ligase E3 C [Cryptococcus deuterogattii 99/473]
MFDPAFLLSNSKSNNVNLSTSTSTSSSDLLSSVRAERLAREEKRHQELAAIEIQKVWRGRKVARDLRERILEDLERRLGKEEGLNVEKAGREMVVLLRDVNNKKGTDRKQLVSAHWCDLGLQIKDGRPSLVEPLNRDPGWGRILGLLSIRLLHVVDCNPTTVHVPSILSGLEAIANPSSYTGFPTQLASTARHEWLESILNNQWVDILVSILSKIISASLPKKKHPSISPIIRLLASPLSAASPSQLAPILTPIVNQLLAIPNLPSSLPLQALTYLSANFHIFDILIPFASQNYQILTEGRLSDELGKTYFLSNLVTFGISGQLLSRSGIHGVAAWMSVVGNILSQMQDGWGKWIEGMTQDEDVIMEPIMEGSDDEIPDDTVVMPSRKPSRPRRLPLPQAICSKLVLLSTPSHISVLTQYIISPPRGAPATLLTDFSSFFLGMLTAYRGSPKWEAVIDSLVDGKKGLALMKSIWRDGVRGKWEGTEDRSAWEQFSDNPDAPCLLLLTHMYCHYLLLTPDDEFFSPARNPFNIDEILQLAAIWRDLAYWGYISGVPSPGVAANGKGRDKRGNEEARTLFTKGVTRVVERNARRQFASSDFWIMKTQMDMQGFVEAAVYEDAELSGLNDEEREVTSDTLPRWARARQRYSKRQMAYISPRLGLLNNLPMAVPFETRVQVFQMFIEADKAKLGIEYHGRTFRSSAKIRRDHVAQDGFDELSNLGPALKGRVDITFVDKYGITEAGIDGGGLYKEFLTILSKEVFDSNRGLWLTTDQNELYPNPHSYASESHNLSWYRFIGQVLGKAIYDGILVDVTFAAFFLAKWLGRQSYLDDLASLDKDLYKGLIILKNDPKPEDMALTFSTTIEEFGVQRQIDLIPGGSEIPVTAENRHEYIQLVCKYKLDKQIAAQSKAFFIGLSDLLDSKWLRMFDQQELQQLIGGEEKPIDLKDLKAHCNFDGFPNDVTPALFWKVIQGFTEEQKRALLRFVTSCSRPPLLGFSQLNPQFGVRFNGGDMDRLPSASACFNLLKLPGYTTEATLRAKLLQAINSGAGFDMS